MEPFWTAFPLQAGSDALSTFLDFLPLIVLIVVFAGLMLWILGIIGRYFVYLKTIESAWLDQKTLDFIRRVLEAVWIAFMAIIILAFAQTRSPVLHDLMAAALQRVPAVFLFTFVVFAAAVVVRALHRFGAYLRGELKTKPKRVAPASTLALAEIVLKYVIYVVALVLAVLGSLRALPASDQVSIQQNVGIVFPAIDAPVVLGVFVGLLAIAVADRFVASIFEDLKRRTTKFTTRALEEFKSIARYGVWIVGAVILLFAVLGIVLKGDSLTIFAVGFIAFMIIVAIFAFEPLQNSLAGVTLMRADPFDVGNRVKIGEDLVCDVVSMSLTLTSVRTLRGELVQIPNTKLLQMPVVNFSRSKPYAIFVEVAVGFDVGHDRVRDLLLKAAAETQGIVKDRPAEVFGKEVDGGAVLYQLFAYTGQPELMKEIKSALIYKIQDLFSGAGIRPIGRSFGP